jgi:hypothetical protein
MKHYYDNIMMNLGKLSSNKAHPVKGERKNKEKGPGQVWVGKPKKPKGFELSYLSAKSPCLHLVFGPPFSPYPFFQWYPQSNEILLNLSVKC